MGNFQKVLLLVSEGLTFELESKVQNLKNCKEGDIMVKIIY